MIVNDDTVSKALQYLAEDPHPIALARKDVTDAENVKRQKYAEVFGQIRDGTVRDRECAVERDIGYAAVCSAESDASLEYERHRARVRAAEMIIEVWRSEQANVRAAEKVR